MRWGDINQDYDCRDPFVEIVGKTMVEVSQNGNESITFKASDGDEYIMCHIQDCCESVDIEDVAGDLNYLVGVPILFADESSNSEDSYYEFDDGEKFRDGSQTWTFYRIGTDKGTVVIRWYGSSNGYYSESADFIKVKKDDNKHE